MNDNYKFCCVQAVFYESVLYSIGENEDVLWEIDLKNRCSKIARFFSSECKSKFSFSSVVNDCGKIVLVPKKSGKTVVLDLSNKDYYEEINLKEDLPVVDSVIPEFYGGITNGDLVYIIGANSPSIHKMDLRNNTTRLIYSINKVDVNNPTFPYCYSNGKVSYDKYVLITGGKNSAIYRINIDTDECSVFDTDSDICVVFGAILLKKQIWLLARNDNELFLVEWKEGKCGKRILVESAVTVDDYWWNPIEVRDAVYIVSSNTNKGYKVDLTKKTVERIGGLFDKFRTVPKEYGIHSIRLIGSHEDKIYFNTVWDKKWYEYDVNCDSVDEFYICINDQESREYIWMNEWNNELRKTAVLAEKEMPLKYYLNAL